MIKAKSIKKKSGAVLVVGGGIAGIQASLDLADSGFKVFLLEKSPAIGGKMPQLDKTFPTNDCSMCILAPKLVAAGRHPNIEIITQGEIEGLSGREGNFTVTVNRQPRYIDPEKCTGCGVCWENCPVRNEIYLEPDEKVEVKLSPEDLKKVGAIIRKYRRKQGFLLPLLGEVNLKYNYLPEDVLRYISEELDLPLSLIYRIATFYDAFSLTPRGRHTIKVCLGTTCYVKGAPRVVNALSEELGVGTGGTTGDLRFSLETVRCLGCCSLAPVMTVDEETYGNLKLSQLSKILKDYE